jgi:MoxR-like ATPase
MKYIQDIELEVSLAIARTKKLKLNDCVTTLLAVGEPGSGKSYLGEILTKIFTGKNVQENFEFYQCHSGTMPQHLIFDINITGIVNKISGIDDETISKGILIKAIEKSKTQKVVLIIDELDKASREVDAFLLDFLQYFRVMDPIHGNIYGNKENCIILITSNDERSFMDAIYRRVSLIEVPYPSEEELLLRLKKIFGSELNIELTKKLIQYFTKIRNIPELSYKPTISEMLTILHDWDLIKDRINLPEILIYKISKDLDDRKFLIENKKFFKV